MSNTNAILSNLRRITGLQCSVEYARALGGNAVYCSVKRGKQSELQKIQNIAEALRVWVQAGKSGQTYTVFENNKTWFFCALLEEIEEASATMPNAWDMLHSKIHRM
jgi:hypothetical protein